MRGSRNRLSEAVISALLRDFSKHGEKAIAKVLRTQPAAYLKCLVLLVPREHKLEHSNPLKAMTGEQLEAGINALQDLLARRAAAAAAKLDASPALPAPDVIDVKPLTAEPVVFPAPEAQSPEATREPTRKHKTNRLMREADTAVGPRERKPSRR
jgi:hypothetical protein